jgi:hypothetical protein
MSSINYVVKISQLFPLIAINLISSCLLVQAQAIGIQEVRGKTGGNVNSGDCGYIADKPNHIINLMQPIYSLKIRVEASQGHPSLLIVGPGNNDRFCILGEANQGKSPEMSGVWEAGKYLIYVGDIQGNQNPFTLKITSEGN